MKSIKERYIKRKARILLFVCIILNAVVAEAQNVGINRSAPQQQLDVNGKLKISDDTLPAQPGTIRFDSMTQAFQGFDGYQWINFGKGEHEDLPAKNEYISFSDGLNDSQFPQCVINDNGQAAIVYSVFTGGSDRLYLSYFSNGTWFHPSDIDDYLNINQSFLNGQAVLDMNNNGDMILVYRVTDSNGVEDLLYLSEYKNGQWVVENQLISVSGLEIYDVEASVADNGDILIGWIENVGGLHKGYFAEKRNGFWKFPENEGDCFSCNLANEDVYNIQISMNESGRSILTWNMFHPAENQAHLYKSVYQNGQWFHPPGINSYLSFSGGWALDDFVVDVNDSGNIIIVWSQEFNIEKKVFKAEFENGSWIYPVDQNDYIFNPYSRLDDLTVGIDDDGEVTVFCLCDHPVNADIFISKVFKAEKVNGEWIIPDNTSPPFINVNCNGSDAQSKLMGNGQGVLLVTDTKGLARPHFIVGRIDGKWKEYDPFYFTFDGSDFGSASISMNKFGKYLLAWTQQKGQLKELYYFFK